MALSSDGKRLAAAEGKKVQVWDLDTGELFLTLSGHKRTVLCAAFDPDGRRLASGSDDGTVKVWDLATRGPVLTLREHGQGVTAVVFSRDGRLLITLAEQIRVWDTVTGDCLKTLA